METMGQNTKAQNGPEKRSIKKIQGVKDCQLRNCCQWGVVLWGDF